MPSQHPLPFQHPPPRRLSTREYGQCAGGTHPTGMHTCVLCEHSFERTLSLGRLFFHFAKGTVQSCDLNGSVRGRVFASRKRYWTLPTSKLAVSNFYYRPKYGGRLCFHRHSVHGGGGGGVVWSEGAVSGGRGVSRFL